MSRDGVFAASQGAQREGTVPVATWDGSGCHLEPSQVATPEPHVVQNIAPTCPQWLPYRAPSQRAPSPMAPLRVTETYRPPDTPLTQSCCPFSHCRLAVTLDRLGWMHELPDPGQRIRTTIPSRARSCHRTFILAATRRRRLASRRFPRQLPATARAARVPAATTRTTPTRTTTSHPVVPPGRGTPARPSG